MRQNAFRRAVHSLECISTRLLTRGTPAARATGNTTFANPSIWDSWGGNDPTPGPPPRCLNQQAHSFCNAEPSSDPVLQGSARYKFTQTFTDAQLHPGVQSSNVFAYGHKSYRITMSAVAHTFHTALPPMAVYAYNGKYPGDTIEAHQGEPIVIEVRGAALPGAAGARLTHACCRSG